MSRRKPSKPREVLTPEERAEIKAEVSRLKGLGAEVALDREGKIVRARRIDVFQLLVERGAIPQDSFDAVRAYEADLATAMGWNTPERRPDYIRGSQLGPPGQNIGDIQMKAYDKCRWVRQMMPSGDFSLISALLNENDGNRGRWRGTVERERGETSDVGQTTAVRCAAANLKDVRDRYQDGRRMAA